MKHVLKPLTALWISLIVVASVAAADGFRMWTDAQGRQIEAFLLDKNETEVTILLRDGRSLPFARERLSDPCQAYVRSWSGPEFAQASVEEAVFALEGDHAAGSGFLMVADGRVWLYTNQHVIAAGIPKTVINARGQTLTLGSLEIHPKLDMARFQVMETRGLRPADDPSLNTPATAYGNSGGSGVLTSNPGKVVGLSSGLIEVDSDIVQGNSGGPILCEDLRVLGMASFVEVSTSGDSLVKEGTRYAGPRRFGIRMDRNWEFKPVGHQEFEETARAFSGATQGFDEAFYFYRSIVNAGEPGLFDEDSFSVQAVQQLASRYNADMRRVFTSLNRGDVQRGAYLFLRRASSSLDRSLSIAKSKLAEAPAVEGDQFGWFLQQVEIRQEYLPAWERHWNDLRRLIR